MPIKISLLVFVFSLLALSLAGSDGYAQQDTALIRIINSDTVVIGKYYYVRTIDGSEMVGKLIGVNNNTVRMIVEDETMDIQKSEIKTIRSSITKEWSVDKPLLNMNKPNSFQLSVGMTYPMDEDRNYSSIYSKSITISAGIMFAAAKYVGFKGDFDYSRLARDDYNMPNDIETGGSLNSFSVRMNFLLGDFIPDDINYYFIIGAGLGMIFKTERKSYYSYYYNGTLNEYNYTEAASSKVQISGTTGLNVNIRVAPKVRIFIEPSLNYVITGGFPNYYALKTGVIL